MTTRLSAIDFTPDLEKLTKNFTGKQWVFDEIDHWLKESEEQFFILTGEPGVGKSAIAARLIQIRSDVFAYHFCRIGRVETLEPERFLVSLAAQLGKKLPHYNEALSNTVEDSKQVNVNIQDNSVIDKNSLQINSKKLEGSNLINELDILIRKPLTLLPRIYQEKGELPPNSAIIIVDALDEALSTTGQVNIVTLLASLHQARETLPSWVRFLFITRPNQSVLNLFFPLQPRYIQELEAKNLSDIQEYIQGRVDGQLRREASTLELQANNALGSNLKPLKQRLEEANTTTEELVREVTYLSQVNYLYTRLIMDQIARGELSVKNLSPPKTLYGIYHAELKKISSRKWEKTYVWILEILAVVHEPITLAQLTRFTGIDVCTLEQSILTLQKFLDETIDEITEEIKYSIFHQSLRDYLLDRRGNPDFWCDSQEGHDLIINYYLRFLNG